MTQRCFSIFSKQVNSIQKCPMSLREAHISENPHGERLLRVSLLGAIPDRSKSACLGANVQRHLPRLGIVGGNGNWNRTPKQLIIVAAQCSNYFFSSSHILQHIHHARNIHNRARPTRRKGPPFCTNPTFTNIPITRLTNS